MAMPLHLALASFQARRNHETTMPMHILRARFLARQHFTALHSAYKHTTQSFQLSTSSQLYKEYCTMFYGCPTSMSITTSNNTYGCPTSMFIPFSHLHTQHVLHRHLFLEDNAVTTSVKSHDIKRIPELSGSSFNGGRISAIH